MLSIKATTSSTIVFRNLLKKKNNTFLSQRRLVLPCKTACLSNSKLFFRYLQTNAATSASSSQDGFLPSDAKPSSSSTLPNNDIINTIDADSSSPSPLSGEVETSKHDHLVEDYVGHPVYFFDTLEVYKELEKANFNHGQAVTIIELIQKNLNSSFDSFDQKFTPKIDLENENYLFEAASSELRVEMKRSREEQQDELRNRINVLEREYNYVLDELNDAMIKCKNECEVALNDHTSDSTLLQKQLNIQIRELENRINSQLISELKFSVESLRWSLTRRGIFSILLVAASVLLAVTSSKIVSNSTPPPQASKPPFNDEYVKDNDEFPKDNDEYVQYEEWHQPKVLK